MNRSYGIQNTVVQSSVFYFLFDVKQNLIIMAAELPGAYTISS